MKLHLLTTTILLFLFHFTVSGSDRYPASFVEKRFTINIRDGALSEFLELVSKQTGLSYKVADSVTSRISYAFKDVTLREAFEQIERDYKLKFTIEENTIYVASTEASNEESGSLSAKSSLHRFQLKYLTAGDLSKDLTTLIGKNDKIFVDHGSNAIVFMGSFEGYSRIKSLLDVIDIQPNQVMIEGQIVEVRKNKVQELGISFGDLTNTSLSNVSSGSWLINNPAPGTPNVAFKLKIGSVDSRALEARLAAAESSGDAKIISRPKVVTINNMAAKINSGITYNVRTLSSSSSSGSSEASLTGGVQSISAGLTLSVLPTVLDEQHIKLKIDVTSSEPDDATKVDGIPGIFDNSASTSIIVQNGSTATMAGLIKNTFGTSQTGVPFLSSIPIIGWLFKYQDERKLDTELLIFITPQLVRELKQATSL